MKWKNIFLFVILGLVFINVSACGNKKSIEGSWIQDNGEEMKIGKETLEKTYWSPSTWEKSEDEGYINLTQDGATEPVEAKLDETGDVLSFDGNKWYRQESKKGKELIENKQ